MKTTPLNTARAVRLLLPLLLAAAALAPPAARAQLAQDAVVSPDPSDSTPHVLDGVVKTILPLGRRVVVGGSFTRVRNAGEDTVLERRNLFAFDAETGRVDEAFGPSVAGEVETLLAAPDGRSFYAGGRFSHIDGVPRTRLARLAAAGGHADPAFSFVTDGNAVLDLALAGGRLLVGGSFATVGGQPRLGLASVNPDSGALTGDVTLPFTAPRQGPVSRVEKMALSPDGRTLVAVGNFTVVNGSSRHQIAMLDVGAVPARLADWQTMRFDAATCQDNVDTYMRDVDYAPDGDYFVVVTSGNHRDGRLCDTATRWESAARGSSLQPTWVAYDGGDSFTAVAVTGTAVYVGGHMRWMNNPDPNGTGDDGAPGPGAVPREGIAALDPQNGLPLTWNPGRLRGQGAWALAATGDGLWIGSDTDRLGGEFHGRLAFMPLAGGKPVPAARVGSLPGYLYTMGGAGGLAWRSFDGRASTAATRVVESVDWSRARGAFMVSGRLYFGWADGRLLAGDFDGGNLRNLTEINLYNLSKADFPVADVTGMFYDAGRLYYSVAGKAKLYYRWFAPESEIVGAETYTAADDRVVDWKAVRGMALAGGQLHYSAGGALRQVDFRGGKPSGSQRTVLAASAGPFDSQGMFVFSPAEPGQAPAAALPTGDGSLGQHLLTGPGATGYWFVAADGGIFSFGDARFLGSMGGGKLNRPVVGMSATRGLGGYWLVASDGGVFSYGDAQFFGSTGAITLNKPIVGMAAHPSGKGYWFVASDGGIFSYGASKFFGSMGATPLNKPIVGMAATPSGNGYWLVASDGGVFSYGDAQFFGSTGAITLNKPIVGMAAHPSGKGYWFVASDGGIFNFGASGFHGSMGATPLNRPIVTMSASPSGVGYRLIASDGGVFSFGDAPFLGSTGGLALNQPIVGAS